MYNFYEANTLIDANNRFEPKKASLGMRIGAFIIDQVIITIILVVPYLIFTFNSIESRPDGKLFMLPILMLTGLLAYYLKDIVKGASVGKRVVGLAVRNVSNALEVPSASKLVLRNILTFLWPIEFLVLVVSAQKMKIGDQITGTDVYYIPKKLKASTIVVAVILSMALFIGSLIFAISSILKNDSSYKMAVNYIETNSEIIDMVGDIQHFGMPSGSLNYSGRYGQASYTIKVIGTKKTIHVNIEMEKKPGKDWEITYIDYES